MQNETSGGLDLDLLMADSPTTNQQHIDQTSTKTV